MIAEVRVEGRTDNIAGVKIPVFNRVDMEPGDENTKEQLGLAGGGRAIANCREKYTNLLELMIKLASLQVLKSTQSIPLFFSPLYLINSYMI